MKIGLVLSGGGSRGFGHLGVLKALDELKIRPDVISGASVGSLIGAFYAYGYTADEISEIILKKGISGNIKLAFNKMGIFSLEKVEKLVKEYLPANSFESLKIHLVIATTEIRRGEIVYFRSGNNLAKVITASCAIPGIFSPVIIEGKSYIDGGVLNNMPIEPIEDEVDLKIGVNVMPIERKMPVSSAKDIIMKSLLMSLGEQSARKNHKFDILIEPKNIVHFNGLSLKNAKEMFDLGYNTAIQQLQKSAEMFL
jgi:NTE family protein